jgi:hypothetical protein
MKHETYKFTVNSHLLSALINGDESALSDKDKQDITEFLAQFGEANISVCVASDDEETENDVFFDRCDIGGLYADCMNINVLVWGRA